MTFSSLLIVDSEEEMKARVLDNTPPYIFGPPPSRLVNSEQVESFEVLIIDWENDTLNITWDWGDGTTSFNQTTESDWTFNESLGLAYFRVVQTHAWFPPIIQNAGDFQVDYSVVLYVDDGMGGLADTSASPTVVTVKVVNGYPRGLSLTIPSPVFEPNVMVPISANATDKEGESLNWTFEIYDISWGLLYREIVFTPAGTPNQMVWANITYLFTIEATYLVNVSVTDLLSPYDEDPSFFPHNNSASTSVIIKMNAIPTLLETVNMAPDPYINTSIGYIEVLFWVDVGDTDGDNLTVDWDFGSGYVFQNITQGSATVYQAMNFTDEGTWTLVINVTDGYPGGSHNISRNYTINVTSNNKPPTVEVYGRYWPGLDVNVSSPTNTENVTFSFVFSDPENDTISVFVDFGDNTTAYFNVTDYIGGLAYLNFTHIFARDGNFTVSVRYTDGRIGDPQISHIRYANFSVIRVRTPLPPVPNPWNWWDSVSLGMFLMVPISIIGWTVLAARRRKRIEEEGYSYDEWKLRQEMGDLEGQLESKIFGEEKGEEPKEGKGGGQEEL
jgi:hypothetical protein